MDPYAKWIVGHQTQGVSGLDALRQQGEDDYTHLGGGEPDKRKNSEDKLPSAGYSEENLELPPEL
jgi:hypothetical protein